MLDRVISASGLETRSVKRSRTRGEPFSLRWILLHMIEEYARHNGHADLIRESIDALKAVVLILIRAGARVDHHRAHQRLAHDQPLRPAGPPLVNLM